MAKRSRRSRPAWLREGPSILGFQPGWLWVVLTVAVLGAGVYIVTRGIGQQQQTAAQIDALIQKHAQQRDLPVDLVRAMVQAESGGDPNATSNVDARGLMQIMPSAQQDARKEFDLPDGNLYDPDYNLLVGTAYLRILMDRFDNDITLVVAAYHMGPTAIAKRQREDPGLSSAQLVEKHAGPMTRAYVARVLEQLAAGPVRP